MTIEKRATAGSIAGIAGLVLNLLQSLLFVPLVLSYWSVDTYGVWMAVSAAVGLLISLDTGHQNYLGNIFNRQWIDDKQSLAETVRSGIRAAAAIALLELLIGIATVLSGRLGLILGDTGPSTTGAAWALILNLVFWVLNGSIGGILVRLYVPAGYFAWSQWLGIIYRVSGFLAVIVAVAAGASVCGAMLAQVLTWWTCNLFTFWDLRRRFPEVLPWWRGGQWSLAWKNFRASLVLTVNWFVEQAAGSGLILFVGHLLNPAAVALFTTVRTVANVGLQGSSIMLSPLTPDLVRYHIKGEADKLVAVFSTSWLLGTSILTAGLLVGVFMLEPLYLLWTRGLFPLDRWLFAFLGTAVAVRQWAAPFQTYLASLNDLRSQSVIAGVRAILGLGLAAIFLPRLGLRAAGMGVLAAEAGAAIVALMSVYRQLQMLGAALPVKPVLYSLTQILIAALVWLSFASGAQGLFLWTTVGALLIVILASQQWRELPHTVQQRLKLLMVR